MGIAELKSVNFRKAQEAINNRHTISLLILRKVMGGICKEFPGRDELSSLNQRIATQIL